VPRPSNKLLLWPGEALAAKGYVARQIHLHLAREIEKVDLSNGMPAGWSSDALAPGKWEVRDDALWGYCEPQNSTILWRRQDMPANFAIEFKAAAMPTHDKPIATATRIGEINAFWNGTGDATKEDFRATVGSLGGWYAGFCGIEHLKGAGGAQSDGTYLSREIDLAPQRPYNIVAGRYDDTDFFFVNGSAASQATTALEVGAGKLVGLATFADEDIAALVRFWDIRMVELTDESIVPLSASGLRHPGQSPGRLGPRKSATEE
jgi:hypothetical protein